LPKALNLRLATFSGWAPLRVEPATLTAPDRSLASEASMPLKVLAFPARRGTLAIVRRMTLGPHVPEWQALRLALDEVVGLVHGKLAVVLDDTGLLWCWSQPRQPVQDRWSDVVAISDAFHAREVATLKRPLRRGGHIGVVRQVTAISPELKSTNDPKHKGPLVALSGGRTRDFIALFTSEWGPTSLSPSRAITCSRYGSMRRRRSGHGKR
jgi:hypothetical protein